MRICARSWATASGQDLLDAGFGEFDRGGAVEVHRSNLSSRLVVAGDPDDDVVVSQQKPKGPVVAAVVGTLSPGDVGKPFTDADRTRAMVSHDWQMLGAQYEWAEVHGVSKGLPHGYFTDLLGSPTAGQSRLTPRLESRGRGAASRGPYRPP